MKLLIATQNRGKLREYQQVLSDLGVTLLTPADIGLGDFDVEETGATFVENAELKARAYAEKSGLLSLADDSGLCVDALDGAPGLYSARYAGKGATDADRRAKLLHELDDVPDTERTAYFICVTALCDPSNGEVANAEGRVYGKIARAESDGPHGFGYDPIFVPDGFDVTLADIPPEQKNALSHRGRAAQNIRPTLERWVTPQQ